jgi:hypothetical protein
VPGLTAIAPEVEEVEPEATTEEKETRPESEPEQNGEQGRSSFSGRVKFGRNDNT